MPVPSTASSLKDHTLEDSGNLHARMLAASSPRARDFDYFRRAEYSASTTSSTFAGEDTTSYYCALHRRLTGIACAMRAVTRLLALQDATAALSRRPLGGSSPGFTSSCGCTSSSTRTTRAATRRRTRGAPRGLTAAPTTCLSSGGSAARQPRGARGAAGCTAPSPRARLEVLGWIQDLDAKFTAEGKEVNGETIKEFA